MEEIGEARTLIVAGKYREAGKLLDRLLTTNRENGELWYLRGIVSLKMKNYEAAHAAFERALTLGRKPSYYQMKGMAHFETFEVEEALDSFKEALVLEPGDVTTNFFIAMCYLFLDDPRADVHIRKAYSLDAKRTKQLLLNFYTLFLKKDPNLTAGQRKRIEERIMKIK